MLELVNAHAQLDEPITTAIWIRQTDREAWLVEIVPSMEDDVHPERHIAFNPGRTFRHPLNLIVANQGDVERAVRIDHKLAAYVAQGEILNGEEIGKQIVELARSVVNDGHA